MKTPQPRKLLSRRILCVVLSAALLAQSGCSLFAPHTQALTITATDPSAEIVVDGSPAGRGTVTLRLARNETHTVLARAGGDRVGTAQIGTTISTTGILDLIGGVLFLVPFLGVLGPGFWSLDRDSVVVYVPPPQKSEPKP